MTEDEEKVEEEETQEDKAEEEVTPPPASNSWRDSLYSGMPETDKVAQRAFKFLFPVFLWISSFAVAHIIWNPGMANKWITLSVMYLVPPLGKESIIPMGLADGFAPYTMAFTVAFVDLWVAMLISWNYWYITKIPKVGPQLKKAEDKGAKTMMKIPVLEKGAWFGIVLLSLIPAIGAGGFFGSIIGKMIGMKPGSVISAVFLGSLLSGLIYAYAAKAVAEAFSRYPYLVGAIIAVAILCVVGFYFYAKKKKAKVEEAETAGAA